MTRFSKTSGLLFAAGLLAALMLFTGTISLAAKGGKGGGGGGGSTPPVLYSVTLIQNNLGGINTAAFDMNDFGIIVGIADNATGDDRAFVYMTETATMVDLNSLLTDAERAGWVATSAEAVNNSGQITGRAKKDGESRAYLFDPNVLDAEPMFVLLPTLPDSLATVGRAINNDGEIVGTIFPDTAGAAIRLFLYTANGTMTDLGGFEAGFPDINDFGQIVINSGTAIGTILGGYRLTPNGNGGFVEEFFSDLEPYAINTSGTFTGETEAEKGPGTPVFRYTDQLEILKDDKKDVAGLGIDINSHGDVGINRPLSIYTDYENLGALKLDDLIVPEDVAVFTEDMSSRWITAIGERDMSGSFPILVIGTRSIIEGNTNATSDESFLLIPLPAGN